MNVEIFKINQQLELSFKFNKAIIEKVKTIKGAKFNGNQKLWSVPLESQDDLLSTFRASEINYEFVNRQDERKNRETNSLVTILNQDDFTVKLPIPKPLWSILNVYGKISGTEKEWVFTKELFMDFHKLCVELNIGVIYKN
ncbi:unnamed protein product [Brachionus calyciflorus]|uniref:Uncharacterized protein n=1 Tax=Brachionus calyciflorus TaxID=104777 RepID=A0A813W9I0_9BILA|nr:unnamed protein product [Brachionus calyciflorus]